MTHTSLHNWSTPVYERTVSAEAEALMVKLEKDLRDYNVRKMLAHTTAKLGEFFDSLGDTLPEERV